MARAKTNSMKKPAAKSGRRSSGIEKSRVKGEAENRAVESAAAIIRKRGGPSASSERTSGASASVPRSPALVQSSIDNGANDSVGNLPRSVAGDVKIRVEHCKS